MLENKKLNMIISLLIAISLWAFVIGEVNPEATRTYREIPIQLINEDVLDDSNLAVYAVSDTVLSVTVTGTRSEVNQISEKDIVATVDLEQAAIGQNQLRIDVKVPSKVDVEAQSLNKVTVTVENKVSKDVLVQVRYNGSFDGEEEPITIEQSMETITVTGAESSIARVDHVDAVVEEGTVTEEVSTFDCKLVPVDVNRSKVYNVDMPVTTIQITAELAKTKTVPLEVPVTGLNDVENNRQITLPETITLKGRSTDLDPIESIMAEPIDVSEITQTTTVEVVPILPEGVEVSSESEKLEATVQVTKKLSKTLTFTGNDIVLDGLDKDFVGEITTKEIQVTIAGSQDIINSITADKFTLSVDLNDLNAGTHTVELNVQCDVDSIEMEYTPLKVKVKIEEIVVEDEPNSDDDNNQQEENQVDEEENIEE